MNYFEDLIYLFSSNRASRGIVRLNIAEGALLYKYAKKKHDDIIVEIGRDKGGSTVILASCLTNGKIYSIDKKLHSEVKDNIKPYKDKIKLITSRSQDVKWKLPIGLLFIDGSHTENGVKKDIKKYVPFVKNDGYVVFHDARGTKHAIGRVVRQILLNKGWVKESIIDSMMVIRRSII